MMETPVAPNWKVMMLRISILATFLLLVFVGPAALAVFGADNRIDTYGRHATLLVCQPTAESCSTLGQQQ